MLVIVLHKYPNTLAGTLSRWLLHVSSGVFVGKVSPRVSEKLWGILQEVEAKSSLDVTFCSTDNSEQGFHVRQLGNPIYSLEDFDGLPLISRTVKEVKRENL